MHHFVHGAVAVVGADVANAFIPPVVDVAKLPVRKAVGAVGGAYLAGMVAKDKHSLKHAALCGISALVAAELAARFVPVTLKVGPIDAVRIAAGGVGGWGINKIV